MDSPVAQEGEQRKDLVSSAENSAQAKHVPPLRSDDLGHLAPSSPTSTVSRGASESQAALHRAGATGSSAKPASDPTRAVAKRPSRSGRQVIHDATTRSNAAATGGTAAGMVTALSVNAQYKTIPEENADFRARNRVRASYRGPVYTVEDVSVPCHGCGGPVDPVTRVPVGSLFFHVNCLQCYLCGRKEGVAGLYVQVDRQAVCSECAARGYNRWVPRQEVQSRGMVYGAIQGDVYDAIDAHDRGERGLPRLSASPPPMSAAGPRAQSTATVVGAAVLNRSTVPGALPPSLTIRPVHNARNTGRRSFALMERQQYYTQSDNNLLMRAPDATASGGGATRRVSKAGKAGGAVGFADQPPQQRITASKSHA